METRSNENISSNEATDFVTKKELEIFEDKFMNVVLGHIKTCEDALKECLKNQKQIFDVAQEALDNSRRNKESIMRVSGLLELLRQNFDTNLQASIKSASNVIGSLKRGIDAEFITLKNEIILKLS